MQADNDLRDFALWDLAEIGLGLSELSGEVFVQLDLPGKEGFKLLRMQPQTFNRPLQRETFQTLTLNEFFFEVIKTYPEESLQKDVMLDLLLTAEELVPTDKTMLVVWGHGEGFSANNLAQFGGIALDDHPRSRITLPELADNLRVYELVFGKQIDFTAFDACLMQTVEVVTQLAHLTPYILGSTQIQDFRGLPYQTLLSFLANKQPSGYELSMTLPVLMEQAVAGFDKLTASSVNTQELYHVFLPQFDKILAEVNQQLAEDFLLKLEMVSQLEEVQSFLGESRDINTILAYLERSFKKKNPDLAYRIGKLRGDFSQSLIAYTYGDYYINQDSYFLGAFKAFGIWFPTDRFQYQWRIHEFESAAFYQEFSEWLRFLDQIYN